MELYIDRFHNSIGEETLGAIRQENIEERESRKNALTKILSTCASVYHYFFQKNFRLCILNWAFLLFFQTYIRRLIFRYSVYLYFLLEWVHERLPLKKKIMQESWIVCDYIIIIDFEIEQPASISDYKAQYPEAYCECGRCDIIRFIYLPNVNFFESPYYNDRTFLIDQSCRQTLLEIHSRIIRRRCTTNSPTICSAWHLLSEVSYIFLVQWIFCKF